MAKIYSDAQVAALLAARARGGALRCPLCRGVVEVTATGFLGNRTDDLDLHCQGCGARGGQDGEENV